MNSRNLIGQPVFVCLLLSGCLLGQTNVVTQHNDIGRTGQNLTETVLTQANVNTNTFGKLFTLPVDGAVYTQPLYMSSIAINGVAHRVVFVATEHDSVYAFDAASGTQLWQASMLTAAHGAASGATTDPVSDTGCGDISQTGAAAEYGITGTPVIDAASGTLYVVSVSYEGTYPVQRLHALDVTTGNEKFGGPVTITASLPGTGVGSSNGVVSFDPKWENQRPGLLELNGTIYLSWGAHCDAGPWHGWIMGYNATTLAQTSVFLTSPNGSADGVWLSGVGLSADIENGTGRIFPVTGNGTYDAAPPYATNTADYGDDTLRLNVSSSGALTVADAFTPYNQALFAQDDVDQGAGGALILPDQAGPNPHLLAQIGKDHTLYLLNRENLGGYNTSSNNVVEQVSTVGGLWGIPAYWNGNIYLWTSGGRLSRYPISNGLLPSSPAEIASQTENGSSGYNFGITPSISANGTQAGTGIVWSVDYTQQPQIVYAHSANKVSTLLWSSAQNSSRDGLSSNVKFTVPTIADGNVFVTSVNQVTIYGLFSENIHVPPAVSLTAPSDGNSFTADTDITLTANAAASSGSTITSVSFLDGTNTLATVTTSPYTFSWPGASVGSHSLTAVATDNTGATSTSTPVNITVSAASGNPGSSVLAGAIAAWSFDSVTGGTAPDITGNGNTLSFVGAVTPNVGGISGSAIQLTGAGYAQTSGPVLDTTGSFSVSAWVNFSGLTACGPQTVVSQDGVNDSGFYLGVLPNCNGPSVFKFSMQGADSTSAATYAAVSNVEPATGTWYHLVAVRDTVAGTMTLYVNGALQQTVSNSTTWSASGPFAVGRGLYNGGTGDYVNGTIDSVMVFNSALTAAQVSAIYQQPNIATLNQQAITFAGIATQAMSTTLTLNATASSSLAVSFSSSTTSVCTVSGSTATFLASGTCTIVATQSGNATYAPATPVSQSFNVSAQLQSISFGAIAAQSVGTQLTLTASASSGLTVSFASSTTGICTVSGDAATLLAPGTCTITASQSGNTTYSAATPVSQSFIVAAAVPPGTPVVSINAGGVAVGIWSADEDYSGGSPAATSATINTSLVANPAPQSVYQTEHYSAATYTIPNLTPGAGYTVNLHFAEIYWNAAGSRQFNVAINGTQVLTNFDIFATAGGENIAVMESFNATASSAGTITIALTQGAADLPKINGIQILAGSAAPSFALATPAASLTVGQGSTATGNITLFEAGGFTGNVALAATGLPSGVTASFGTNPTTGWSVLTLTASSTAATGTSTINITGTSGSLSSSIPITLTVNAAALTSQTINFGTIAAQTVGTPLTLAATASSGLAVSYASSTTGICAVSGGTATFLAAGTCTITASQSGNNTYAAATPVSQSFTVNAAPLKSQSITFGTIAAQTVGTPLTLTATASSGLAVSYASSPTSICTVSGSTTTFLATGNCTITASQSGNNTYSAATPVSQSFTVNAEAQTITFGTIAAQTVGTPLTLTATASSGLAVSYASSSTSICTVSGSTATFLATGTCTITASQSGNSSYAAATNVSQSFTVNAAPLKSQTIIFGTIAAQTVGTPLTLTASASSGLAVSYASSPTSICTVSGSTATFLAAGNCTITASQSGNSSYAAATSVSQSFTVNAQSQTITFGTIAAQTVGTQLTLAATASSGLAVSYASSTTSICTVSGGTATFLAAGTCTITASQSGNSSYAAATSVSQSFTVNAQSQTITFGTIAAQTVGTPLTLAATASSGLAVSYASSTTSICTVSGGTATFLAVGTCTITASQSGNSSYAAATNVSQSFTVNAAPLKSQTIIFGAIAAQTVGAPLTLTASASSGLAVSYASSTTSICTVSGSTATFLAAGTCTITASQSGNSTYSAATSVSQSFTVNAQSQTITFGTIAAQTVGTPLTLAATASSGLAVSYASSTTSICTVSGSTATFLAAGSCTITASQSGNNTYAAANSVSQSFTVNAAPLKSQTITFGTIAAQTVGTPLTLTASASSGLAVSYASSPTSICTVSGSTATFLAAGNCTITASQSGNSSYAAATSVSQSFTVNAQAQSISFGAIAAQTVGTPLTLTASASSGLAVSYASSPTSICTVSGSTATFLAAGTCTITASQSGNSSYAAATPVSQSLTVNPQSQTISFGTIAAQTVGTPLTLAATATSGLAVSYASSTTSICTVSGSTAAFLAVGACTITASQSGNNTYAAATPVSQSFTVNAAPLKSQTIAFGAIAAQTVGTPLTLTATATSGLGVSYASSTPSICAVSGIVATFLASGTCSITATQSGNTTYAAATSVSQSFIVNAQSQTISFGTIASQSVGAPLTLSATASSGLAVSYASSTPSICTVSGSTTTFLAPGTCTITATQSGSATYAAAPPVSESFSVATAVQPGNSLVSINAGGVAAGIWSADEDYSGGAASSTTAAIDTSLVANPAPQSVYQTERYGGITYTVPNLTPGAGYTVNLHFAEIYWNAAGSRQFNVAINGTQVLTNFDIFATAGGENIAVMESFNATASSAGTITIALTQGAADLPKINGIQILAGSAAPSFTLATPAASLTVGQGSTATGSITLFEAGGFTGNVALAATGLPSGVTASFGTNPTTGWSVLTLTASSTAATGTSTINITGTSGSLSSSIPITLTVNAAALTSQTISFGTIAAQAVGTPLTLAATASSGLAVSYASSTTSICAVSGGTATFLSAGTCTITASQSGNNTYAAATPVSQSFTVNAQAQTINFGTIAAQAVGTPLTLTASASSGLPVSYTSSTTGICTVSGGTATFLAAGTCTITALQSGNNTYTAANSVSQSFTVNAQSQTINFGTIAAQTVGTPLTLTASANSGLSVSYASSTTSICTVSGATATFLAAGTCTITASQSGNNTYAAANSVSQSFTVNAQTQTINFGTIAAQTVGTPLTLAATASSGLAVSYASSTTSICTVSGSAATFLAAGTCNITASQSGNNTYSAATPVSQSFAVNAAALKSQTITFNAIPAQTVGSTLTLTATASSGLAVTYTSSTTTLCTVSGSTATLLAAGTCTITASQAGNSIYAAAAPLSQSFTVQPAATSSTTIVSLGSAANVYGIFNNGSTVTNGGLDTSSYAYSANLLGTSLTFQGIPYSFGTAGSANATTSTTLALPAGSYSTLNFLGTATYGNQPSQTFTVTYTDGTTATFTQSMSDWGTPQSYAGETIASTMSYRLSPNGTPTSGSSWDLYSYSFALNGGKNVKSFTLPNSRNVTVLAVTLSSSASQAAQTITFGTIAAQTVGTPLTLTATASSGLAVSYASSTTSICTVSGSTATFLAAGTCSITASQSGNATYSAASPVSQSFTVKAAALKSQTITFGTIAAQTVGTSLTLTATASSGLAVSYASSTTGICTVSGSTATFLAAGTCTLTASQAGNSTYAAAPSVSQSFTVAAASTSSAMRFIPITPFRAVDTRNSTILSGGTSRSFTIAGSGGVPTTALAYSLNVTVVPSGTLSSLTVYPTGGSQPAFPLMSSDGRTKAQAAIIQAGSGGALTVAAANTTQVIIDVNGYFVPASNSSGLAFYPVTPTRLFDTRSSTGLTAGQTKTFAIQSTAGIPATAQAYSLNITAIPSGNLGDIIVWPAGQTQPPVSTLNTATNITANAAIVGAGTNGSISIYSAGSTNLLIDINGYWAPAGSGGLSLYPVTPVRTYTSGTTDVSGTVVIPAPSASTGIPGSANALLLNATVTPSAGLGYLELWAAKATQPSVSTLNANDGSVTSNLAIVGTSSGSVDAYAQSSTLLTLDVYGYFAP